MNNSVTMQDLVQLEKDYLNQIREINTAHRKEVKDIRLAKESIEIEADQISYDLGKMRTEVKDLRFEIANLRDRLKTDARSIAYYIEQEAKLDRMLNKTK